MSKMQQKYEYYLLFCSERSGSNFVVDFIQRQTGVLSLPVSHLLRLLTINRLKFGDFKSDIEWLSFINYCQRIIDTGVGSFDKGIVLDKSKLLKIKRRDVFSILDHIVSCVRFNGKKVIIKENMTFEFLPALLCSGRINGIIYQVRNPIGVVSSLIRSKNHFIEPKSAITKWNREQLAFLRALGYVRDSLKTIIIRYEDLVNDPTGMLSKFKKFLKVKKLSSSVWRCNRKANATIENLKLIDGSVKRNRNDVAVKHLNSSQIKLIEKGCFDLMLLFGYIGGHNDISVNLYPEWLIEEDPEKVSGKIKEAKLQKDEKNLRLARCALLYDLMNRKLDYNLPGFSIGELK